MTLTLTQINTAIQDYTNNDEATFVTNLPIFVRAAEEKILKAVRLNLFTKTAQGTMTDTNEYLAVPSDFLAPKTLSIGVTYDADPPSQSMRFLRYKTLDFIQTYTPAQATTGIPVYYAMFDLNTFIVAPTPDGAYLADLVYLYRPASLTAGAGGGTTWLSINAEFALLYGALVEAYTFMKGEADLLQFYEKQFGQAVMALKQLGEAHEVEDEYSTGPVMRQKQ